MNLSGPSTLGLKRSRSSERVGATSRAPWPWVDGRRCFLRPAPHRPSRVRGHRADSGRGQAGAPRPAGTAAAPPAPTATPSGRRRAERVAAGSVTRAARCWGHAPSPRPRPLLKPAGCPVSPPSLAARNAQTLALRENRVSCYLPQGGCPGKSSKHITDWPGNPFISAPSAAAL